MLHWSAGVEGHGGVLSGDGLMVASDRRHVSFMYSFPNYIPLSASTVEQVVRAIEPYSFNRVLPRDAKEAVIRSAERYRLAISSKQVR